MAIGAKRDFIAQYGNDWETLDVELFAYDDAHTITTDGNADGGKLVCCYVNGRSIYIYSIYIIHD
jgi:hypothetical protein